MPVTKIGSGLHKPGLRRKPTTDVSDAQLDILILPARFGIAAKDRLQRAVMPLGPSHMKRLRLRSVAGKKKRDRSPAFQNPERSVSGSQISSNVYLPLRKLISDTGLGGTMSRRRMGRPHRERIRLPLRPRVCG
ncbi:MAG: hypothetical protein RLO21_20085 [Nitratireductor sp.]